MATNPSTQTGFALLITLIVVGVVLSVGLSMLDLSIKQVRLSTNAKQSEIAFHAANAGMECGRFWRRNDATSMEAGQSINPRCFGDTTPDSSTVVDIDTVSLGDVAVVGDGAAYLYTYSFSWGGTEPRCSEITTMVIVADAGHSASGVTVEDMPQLIAGFPSKLTGPAAERDNKTCAAGSRCTVISARGYNKICNNINTAGTIQREVLLQF